MSLPFGIGRYTYDFTKDAAGATLDQFGQPAHGDKNWGDYLGKYPAKMQPGGLTQDGKQVEINGVQYKQGTLPYKGMVNHLGKDAAMDQLLWANADRDGIYINSFEGWFLGAGVSYGYHWILTPRFSMEFTLGLGFAYLDYEKTRCSDCRQVIAKESDTYFGPTRAGINLVWMLK
jgi:hypothetical protein